MRLLVICRDVLLKDGLIGLLHGMKAYDKIVSMDYVPTEKLKSGEFQGAIYVMEENAAADKRSLAALKAQQKLKLLAVAPDQGTTWKIFDEVVLRKRGFEALKEAARRTFGTPAVAEAKSFVGRFENLTPRERQASKLVANAFTNMDIALQLGIREQSVKNLVSTIMRKLEVGNRTELAIKLQSSGY